MSNLYKTAVFYRAGRLNSNACAQVFRLEQVNRQSGLKVGHVTLTNPDPCDWKFATYFSVPGIITLVSVCIRRMMELQFLIKQPRRTGANILKDCVGDIKWWLKNFLHWNDSRTEDIFFGASSVLNAAVTDFSRLLSETGGSESWSNV